MLASARMLSRRSIISVIVFGVFIGALLITSHRLSESCPDGRFCPDLASLRNQLPSLRPGAANKDHQQPPTQHTTSPSADTDTIPTETSETSKETEETDGPVAPENDPKCVGFPDTSNVLVIMKTGASEAYGKIPTQILTNMRCLPEFLLFSDMDQTIAGYHIQDSLDDVLQEVKVENKDKDFEIYFHQQACAVDQELCNKNYDTAKKGWALDKYKNVHIAEKTWKMRPNYDWYLYIDADTYVVWASMVQWLKTLDHTKPLYLGSVAYLGGFPFGHGGSGYLVSQPAMKKMFDGRQNVANVYDYKATQTCCGDYLFSFALKNETSVEVQNQWPTINGEKPHTIPYSDEEWCQPIATMHHVGAEEVSDIDAFERARNYSSPVRFRELYYHFVEPALAKSSTREDWDNLSEDNFYLNKTSREYEDWEVERQKGGDLNDSEKMAHLSFEDCREACESLDDCFQYRFHNGICGTSRKFKHGKPIVRKSDEDGPDGPWRSGWNMVKIREWLDQHKECGGIEWPRLR